MTRETVRPSRSNYGAQPGKFRLSLRQSMLAEAEAFNAPHRHPTRRPVVRAPDLAKEVSFLAELRTLRRPPNPTARPLPGIPASLRGSTAIRDSESVSNTSSAHSRPVLEHPLAGSSSLPYLAVCKDRLTIAPARRSRVPLTPCVGRRTRTSATGSEHLLSRSEVVEYLGRLQWFAGLSHEQLQTLYSRAKLKQLPQDAAVTCEGSWESYCFYILLAGAVCITSCECGIPLLLPQDSGPQAGRRHFGEAALVARVRREATVSAVKDCHLLSFTLEDMAGLPVDLRDVRIPVISNMLAKVPFYKDLPQGVRDGLGAFMGVEYHGLHTTIFEEGGVADKLYVIVEGRVSMSCKNHKGVVEQVCTYSTKANTPTFGELALWSAQPRKGTARAIEPCSLLVVRKFHFSAFLELVPEFTHMFTTSASAFDQLNQALNQLHDHRARNEEFDSAQCRSHAIEPQRIWASGPGVLEVSDLSPPRLRGEGGGELPIVRHLTRDAAMIPTSGQQPMLPSTYYWRDLVT